MKKVFLSQSKYHDYDDNKYRGIRDVRRLFNQSFDKDYYKPIETISSIDDKNNYTEYESTRNMKAKEIKITNYHLKNILI